MKPTLPADLQNILRFFCDHLVVLCGSYVAIDAKGKDTGEEKFFAYSGFVLSVRGMWCLVTAGHAIQDLESNLREGRIRLTNTCLADYFGSKPKVQEPTPFDYGGAGKIFIDDAEEGLDFALLTLRSLYQSGLEANGIRAISEVNWVAQTDAECELYALLGLPNCLVDDPTRLVPYGGSRVAGVINPTMVPVEPVRLPPEEMLVSRYQWFVGRVGAASDLPDITGMSGGPIFGLSRGTDGQCQYWIVAVQSRWRPKARIIFACPVRVFARLVEGEMQRYEKA